MSMSSAAEPIHRSPAATVAADASRGRIARVATFVTLTTGLAIVATVAGTPPAVLPFILAFAPLIVGSLLAWHEGNGALGQLLRMAVRLPRSANHAREDVASQQNGQREGDRPSPRVRSREVRLKPSDGCE